MSEALPQITPVTERVHECINNRLEFIPYRCLGEFNGPFVFFTLRLTLLFLKVTLDSSGILRLALRFTGVPLLPLKTKGSRGITHLSVIITVFF